MSEKWSKKRDEQPSVPNLYRAGYDISQCEVGVVHVGMGAFHRAHQAVYFDALMDKNRDLRWAIVGVNLCSEQSADLDKMAEQQGRYVLKTCAPDGQDTFRLIQVHKGFLDWSCNPQAAEDIVTRPSVKILSMTITEGGYYLGDDGELSLTHAYIAQELAGGPGKTIYAYLRGALNRRRCKNAGPITILCCDNLRKNGNVLSRNFIAYLQACGDIDLLAWLEKHVTFPCSMVDRITPRPSLAIVDEVRTHFDGTLEIAIHSEIFTQWVIEDVFLAQRPPLDTVGVQFVSDVTPYEEAKIRLLNGGHTVLAYLAALHGYQTYDQALRDLDLETFFDRFQTQEAIPALGKNLPIDLLAYSKKIKERFLNAALADSIVRITTDGASKFPIFILPTIKACFAMGIDPHCGLTAIASWYVFMRRVHDKRIAFAYADSNESIIQPFLASGQERNFASNVALWGAVPSRYPQFITQICAGITEMERRFG